VVQVEPFNAAPESDEARRRRRRRRQRGNGGGNGGNGGHLAVARRRRRQCPQRACVRGGEFGQWRLGMSTRAGYSKKGVAKGATGPPTHHLPSHVYELFNPRPPLEFVAPPRAAWEARASRVLAPDDARVVGLAQHLALFDKHVSLVGKAPPGPSGIPRLEELKAAARAEAARARLARRVERSKTREAALAARAAAYDPNAPSAPRPNGKVGPPRTRNAYNSMFVGNLPRASNTKDALHKLFEPMGKVVAVAAGAGRSYAFIEFATGEELKAALAKAQGLRVDNRRVVVDVERARTVPGWKPKRLGGGVARPAASAPMARQHSGGSGAFGSGAFGSGAFGGDKRGRESDYRRDDRYGGGGGGGSSGGGRDDDFNKRRRY
jgi:U1 small nuclear ribonucleoprotein